MYQYIDRECACKEFNLSKQTVNRVFTEIEGASSRYGDYAFRGDGKTRQVRYAVMDDYMRYRRWFQSPDSRRYVPPFDVHEAERELGVIPDIEPQVDLDELAHKVLQELSNIIAGKA